MMQSWASRSRCCAWEACSESSSGVVHPAEPSVASSWGPVTQTQGMESQSGRQQTTHSFPYRLSIPLSSLSFALFTSLPLHRVWKIKPKKSLGIWLSACLALLRTLSLNSRVEPTEDWRQESRDKGRRERIRESNNTLTTPTGTLRHTHAPSDKP